jgi:predicted dehydrogenase
MYMNKLNVGVAGCGKSGPGLVRNFRSLSGCNLKMICDNNVSRLNRFKSIYPDVALDRRFEHMLNGIGLDAVVVATSVASHFPMAKAALLAGKHVMIENPMAASAKECEELIEIARRRQLVLMVGHAFLFSPALGKVKEIIDRGDLGQIRYISARSVNPGMFQKDNNVAWDLAPHDISIILHLLQQLPESVNCGGGSHMTPGVEDVTSMSLNFGEGRSAIIHSSWLDPRPVREITIVGSKQMIIYDDLAPQEKVRIFDVRVDHPPQHETLPNFQYTYHYGDISSPFLKHDEPLKAECLHFLDCIQKRQQPRNCGTRGLELVRILEASTASLKLGGARVPIVRSQISAPALSDIPSDPVISTLEGSETPASPCHRLPEYAAAAQGPTLLWPVSLLPQVRLHHCDSTPALLRLPFDEQLREGRFPTHLSGEHSRQL